MHLVLDAALKPQARAGGLHDGSQQSAAALELLLSCPDVHHLGFLATAQVHQECDRIEEVLGVQVLV